MFVASYSSNSVYSWETNDKYDRYPNMVGYYALILEHVENFQHLRKERENDLKTSEDKLCDDVSRRNMKHNFNSVFRS